jgi:DNA-binding MurR/RpiR family transcriptional regulator
VAAPRREGHRVTGSDAGAGRAREPAESLAGDHGEIPAGDPAASPDIVVRIRSLLPSLAPAEQRVSIVIAEDPERAAHLTISDLARLADTSETTVIRFCRSVGTASYPDLRIAVATSAARANADGQAPLSPDIDADDPLEDVVAKIAGSDARAVQDTASALDLTQLRHSIDAVVQARRIDVYGVGASGLVALDMQQKLHRIGLAVFAWPDPHMAITSAANLETGDLAVGVSHTGATTDTIDALALARHRGALTLAITNFAGSPITAVADLVLCTSAHETTFRSGAMASRIAALTVVDCLFVGVAQRNRASAAAALARTHAALGSRRRPSRRRG